MLRLKGYVFVFWIVAVLSHIMFFLVILTISDLKMTPRLKLWRQRLKLWRQRPKIGNDWKIPTKNLTPKWRQNDAKATLLDATLVQFGGLKQDYFLFGLDHDLVALCHKNTRTWHELASSIPEASFFLIYIFDCHGAPPKPNVELLFLVRSCQYYGVARGQRRIGTICEGGILNTNLFNLFQVYISMNSLLSFLNIIVDTSNGKGIVAFNLHPGDPFFALPGFGIEGGDLQSRHCWGRDITSSARRTRDLGWCQEGIGGTHITSSYLIRSFKTSTSLPKYTGITVFAFEHTYIFR